MTRHFPSPFLWGAATAAHQVEGAPETFEIATDAQSPPGGPPPALEAAGWPPLRKDHDDNPG
ncbi:family 1 glycosylhydrolase [Agromyces albus]|uniref:Glycosyl hydrolase family protein n=1 Tax=Agromyces albus TaxID=205332 RepID=A0A4Q2L1D7_9MICO|nr:glycosyl hydrolase family protein [Agromyces albus]